MTNITKWGEHGANPEKLYLAFGLDMPNDVIDFSTNTNSAPITTALDFDLQKMLCSYPDDDASSVKKIIAKQNLCSYENVLVTNGSNEAIYLIASYAADGGNALMQPLYGEYETALLSYSAKVRNILSLQHIGKDDRTIWICNPSNPTGRLIKDEELDRVFSAHPNKLFVVDEAYRDFVYNEEEKPKYKLRPNVIILRSLTKIYHLCGARIGYVMSDKGIISMLKRRQPTWSVNSLAQNVALSFLNDKDFISHTKAYYKQEMPRLASALLRLGFKVLPSSVNYFLLETADDEALIKFLLTRGIVVRHTRNFFGLDGRYVRIAARSPENNDRLIAAFREYGQK